MDKSRRKGSALHNDVIIVPPSTGVQMPVVKMRTHMLKMQGFVFKYLSSSSLRMEHNHKMKTLSVNHIWVNHACGH